MPKFPVDAPRAKVIKTFELLGFQMVRKGTHIKTSTLRTICTQSGGFHAEISWKPMNEHNLANRIIFLDIILKMVSNKLMEIRSRYLKGLNRHHT